MSQRMYSVEQVAELLGLHVKTVRGYVRDGRLNAVRIGKQYRISHDDLEALTGGAVAPAARDTVRRQRHVEVSSIVQIDAIGTDAMSRVSTMLMAAAQGGGERALRIETVYDPERATMKIIVLGGLGDAAEVLRIIQVLVEESP